MFCRRSVATLRGMINHHKTMSTKLNTTTILIVQIALFTIFMVYLYSGRKGAPIEVEYQYFNRRQSKDRQGLTRYELLGNYDDYFYHRLDRLVARNASENDPEAIALVKDILDPPSFLNTYKLSRLMYKTPQAEAIDNILKGQRDLFFVEVGGFDGERSSNTLFFEYTRFWNGLLIEADPFFYAQLLGKNRRCWSLNACVSPVNYVTKLTFQESDTGRGKLTLAKMKGGLTVPCFPFQTIMSALDVSTIDFFSLDVEGFELHILKTINFQKLDIRTLAVEFMHGNKEDYRTFMAEKGFRVNKTIAVNDPVNFLFAEDFIFVRNDIL